MVTFGAILMIISGVAAMGVQAVLVELTSSLDVDTSDLGAGGKSDDDSDDGESVTGSIDLLLLGIDVRNGQDVNNARADTILLLHVPKTHDQAYLMSIPRDTLYQTPQGGNRKITEVFYDGAQNGAGWRGGMKAMATAVNQLTGIKFDGAAVIDFGGFKKIIDVLGDVHICVDADTPSLHHYYVNGKVTYVNEHEARTRGLQPYVHKKNCRDMAGWEALDFSRQRYGVEGSDYGRQKHQQQLIKAMAKKATSAGFMTDFGKVSKLIKAAGKALVINTNGTPMNDFLFTMRGVAGADLVLLKTNAGWFNSIKINGIEYEQLGADSLAMFKAARRETLGRFLLENPDFINAEK